MTFVIAIAGQLIVPYYGYQVMPESGEHPAGVVVSKKNK